MNETTPLLNKKVQEEEEEDDGNSSIPSSRSMMMTTTTTTTTKDIGTSSSGDVEALNNNNTTTTTTTTSEGSSTGSVVDTTTTTKPSLPTSKSTSSSNNSNNNIPIIEILALTAIISGSLSMYWGISGIMLATSTTVASVIMTTIFTQPITMIHLIMSTCVVVLAPVVTVQKLQLHTMGSLQEQQNELRSQINELNIQNDILTKSITDLEYETKQIDMVHQGLEQYAKSTGTTTDRLVELCNEQQSIYHQMKQHLQAKIVQQIITITLQCDVNQNYIINEAEIHILISRLQSIPGVQLNIETFQRLLQQSEPQNSLTLIDICSIVRNMQLTNSSSDSTAMDQSVELTSFGDPVFVFQPNDILPSLSSPNQRY